MRLRLALRLGSAGFFDSTLGDFQVTEFAHADEAPLLKALPRSGNLLLFHLPERTRSMAERNGDSDRMDAPAPVRVVGNTKEAENALAELRLALWVPTSRQTHLGERTLPRGAP